jgi:HK97 gp10 family phage protein
MGKNIKLSELGAEMTKWQEEAWMNLVVAFADSARPKAPIKTGRLRGSFHAGLNSENEDENWPSTLEADLEAFKLGDRVLLTNNAPYSGIIEYGTEYMAPRPFMRTTAEEIPQLVSNSRPK